MKCPKSAGVFRNCELMYFQIYWQQVSLYNNDFSFWNSFSFLADTDFDIDSEIYELKRVHNVSRLCLYFNCEKYGFFSCYTRGSWLRQSWNDSYMYFLQGRDCTILAQEEWMRRWHVAKRRLPLDAREVETDKFLHFSLVPHFSVDVLVWNEQMYNSTKCTEGILYSNKDVQYVHNFDPSHFAGKKTLHFVWNGMDASMSHFDLLHSFDIQQNPILLLKDDMLSNWSDLGCRLSTSVCKLWTLFTSSLFILLSICVQFWTNCYWWWHIVKWRFAFLRSFQRT